MQKVLNNLTDKGKMTCKEFGKQKLYWRNQVTDHGFHILTQKKDLIEVGDSTQIGNMDAKILQLQDELTRLTEECKNLEKGKNFLVTKNDILSLILQF